MTLRPRQLRSPNGSGMTSQATSPPAGFKATCRVGSWRPALTPAPPGSSEPWDPDPWVLFILEAGLQDCSPSSLTVPSSQRCEGGCWPPGRKDQEANARPGVRGRQRLAHRAHRLISGKSRLCPQLSVRTPNPEGAQRQHTGHRASFRGSIPGVWPCVT